MITPLPPEGRLKYYIFAADWKNVQSSYPKVKLDITYIDEPERPAVCNISFIQRKESPRTYGNLYITGDGVPYPLEEAKILLVSPKDRTLRITSNISEENFRALLEAQVIGLDFTLDGGEFRCIAPKKFLGAKDQVREGLSYFQQ
jgi:hypothetical protein